MRFEAADGGPTLFAYLVVSGIAVGIAVGVLLAIRAQDWRKVHRDRDSDRSLLDSGLAELDGLKCVVREIRDYVHATATESKPSRPELTVVKTDRR